MMLEQVVTPQAATQGHGRRHVHLVGIGGSGMSAIAWVLLGRGFVVSGSDLRRSRLTDELEAAGVTFFLGHAAANVQGAETVVVSSAIPPTNPELAAAGEAGIPVLKRAEFLGHLMVDHLGIAIAGTHGKTTTTGMVAEILIHAGMDPTVILGGALPSSGRSGRAGLGLPFLVEADEYDHMFLGLRPRIAVITNIEHDHPDLFPTSDDYQGAFRQFASLVPLGGTLVGCLDDPGVRKLVDQMPANVNVIGYGLSRGEASGTVGRWMSAVEMRPNPSGGFDFLVTFGGETLGLLRLRVPGQHNVRNALAAVAVALTMNVPFAITREALAAFGGISRRFQLVGEVADVTVVDDYAHHPTEIRATLAAARQHYPGRRIWAVWQPHTFSRTQLLLEEFASAFADADRVVALDIYRSREAFTTDIDTGAVVAKMTHPYARYVGKREDAAAYILDRVRRGDVILTLGAGDSDEVGRWILDGLQDANASRNR